MSNWCRVFCVPSARCAKRALAQLVQLGQNLAAWSEEIVAMWRTAITESPKAFTTKWNSSVDKPAASATSKTTDSE